MRPHSLHTAATHRETPLVPPAATFSPLRRPPSPSRRHGAAPPTPKRPPYVGTASGRPALYGACRAALRLRAHPKLAQSLQAFTGRIAPRCPHRQQPEWVARSLRAWNRLCQAGQVPRSWVQRRPPPTFFTEPPRLKKALCPSELISERPARATDWTTSTGLPTTEKRSTAPPWGWAWPGLAQPSLA